jgi:two-component system, OmpR family, sensor histidine kinase KdpD
MATTPGPLIAKQQKRLRFLQVAGRGRFASAIARYLLVISTLGLTTVPLFLQRSALNTSTVAIVFLLPVLISAMLWGLGPAIVASLLAFLAYNYLFLIPYYTFVVHSPQEVVTLVIFLLVAVLISELVGRAKSNLGRSMDRERELSRLYELSLALAGLNNIQEIAQITARQVFDTFGADCVLVRVGPTSDNGTCSVQLPAAGPIPADAPACVVALQTARGDLGEIRLWRGEPWDELSQGRMLRTFSTQAALALERAVLAQAETRSRVLEESDRLKTALLSSVSHELRTPLATIKAATTSLLGGGIGWDTPAREDLLAVVDEETDKLNHLVGNLLDMSRIEAGALRPNRRWNDLAEIVDGTVERMHRTLKDYRLRIDIPDDLFPVPVDYAQMEQVFTNLLSNCSKYAPGGSTIQIIAAARDDETLLVQVLNEGPPVPAAHLGRIFDKFYQRTDQDHGIGLGLSICKGIVEAHGGTIWAENLPGGFAFKFEIPLTSDGLPSPRVATESA